MTEPLVIDTQMHGHNQITAAFLVTGERNALVETGPRSTIDNVLAALEAQGIDRIDDIVVTHIHLDHAGAAGTLAQVFPEATVHVHEVGAPHLIDPSKLWSSASRIYGDAMEQLWGGIDPLPAERVRALTDGDKIDLGGRTLEAIDTPGHAYHHHVYLDDATGAIFTGDAVGVRLPDLGVVRPATPPPEFHLPKAIASIERIAALEPSRLYLTHFGPQDAGLEPISVAEQCARAIEGLRKWDELVSQARETATELDDITELVTAAVRAGTESLPPEKIERMENTSSYRMNTWGYMRYQDKQDA